MAVGEAFKKIYIELDNDISSQEVVQKTDNSGCTAVSVFLTDEYILCANAGKKKHKNRRFTGSAVQRRRGTRTITRSQAI